VGDHIKGTFLMLVLMFIFHSLKRGEDGKFKDSDLAAIMKNAYVALPGCTWQWSDDVAGSSIQPPPLEHAARPIL